jgi:hypothetical protein
VNAAFLAAALIWWGVLRLGGGRLFVLAGFVAVLMRTVESASGKRAGRVIGWRPIFVAHALSRS